MPMIMMMETFYCLVLVLEAVGHHFPRQLLTEEGGQQGIKDTTEVNEKKTKKVT